MNKIVIAIFGLITGSTAGYFVGYKMAQKKYFKLADKEVKEITDYYEHKIQECQDSIDILIKDNEAKDELLGIRKIAKDKKEVKKKDDSKKKSENKLPDNQVSSIVKPNEKDEMKQYVDYSSCYKGKKKEMEASKDDPRPDLIAEAATEKNPIEIISPEDYGDKFLGYYKETLYYYADGVLADEQDNVITDIENTVGYEALNSIGKYMDSTIHVRNHRLEEDFEILQSLRDFSNINSGKAESCSPEDE